MSVSRYDLSAVLQRLTSPLGRNDIDIASVTQNVQPFAPKKHSKIFDSVEKHLTSKDYVRSSAVLVEKLKSIIDECLIESINHCWSIQSVKSRLDSLMKVAVPFVVTPHLSSFLGGETGLYGESRVPFLDRTKGLIVELFSFFIDAELAVYESGSDVALDGQRSKLLLSLLAFKCNTFSLLPVTVSEYSPVGLQYLAQHLLGVSALAEDITIAIQSLTSRLCLVIMESGRARRGSDEAPPTPLEALRMLRPHIQDFFSWLRQHKTPLTKLCRIAEVVECVHPSLRASLQNESYRSSRDIIEKYRTKYKDHLTLIPLPLQPFRRGDVKQALKDCVRESFLVNNSRVEGSNFLNELLEACRDTYVRPPSPTPPSSGFLYSHSTDGIVEVPLSVSPTANNLALHDSDSSIQGLGKPPNSTVRFVELLLRFLLIAASRTYSSGDAFFVLEDLFGGEGLCLRGGGGAGGGAAERLTKITLQPDSALVELTQLYDLYLADSIGSEEHHIAPLVSFETTVRTLLSFKDLFEADKEKKCSGSRCSSPISTTDSREASAEGRIRSSKGSGTIDVPSPSLVCEMFLLLSASPDKVCHRTLTIVPYISPIDSRK